MLTEISDANGNRIRLHYEDVGNEWSPRHRLVAVEDALGRILKFYYELEADDVSNSPRYQLHHNRHLYQYFITKIEFGLGTPEALSTVYQSISYSYSFPTSSYDYAVDLTEVRRQLDVDDPRGSELVTQYEYSGALSAIVSPAGHRTEFDYYGSGIEVSMVRAKDGSTGAVLHLREYYNTNFSSINDRVYDIHQEIGYTKKRNSYSYSVSSGQINSISRLSWQEPPEVGQPPRSYYRPTNIDKFNWGYDSKKNVISTDYYDYSSSSNNSHKWRYKIYYVGSNQDHNVQMGNPTKWEQISTTSPYETVRKWEADYETTYNRPIWQIDAMGHKTEFSYDANGNLTEVRSKASTGTQPHAVDHDIVTTHEYDTYGNRIKTTFMPGTAQQKIVQTVYDSTHHTYPVEVKTTVTVNGAAHIIRTRSEWDVNRGLKTADIDAQGRRTEYVYWKDGRLKYTRRVADNVYAVPTYDKNGNVTMTQVRQNNWQTGTLLAQTKTEYDGMGRVVKAHSFNNNNWTTPYATSTSTYDIFGYLTQSKDPRGLITNYTYDKFGRVTKGALPDGIGSRRATTPSRR